MALTELWDSPSFSVNRWNLKLSTWPEEIPINKMKKSML
tara:strand:- start:432 stop:548 length:117 start_codon:yes stop_codon:yes gene_type:complete